MPLAYPCFIYRFEELPGALLYDILALRSKIFVVEQQIIYQDIDGKDPQCLHLCMMDGGKLMGYARLIPPGVKHPEAAIGRLVVDADYRGRKLGAELMLYAIDQTAARYPGHPIVIEAQAPLQAFYESLGYTAVSEPYMLEGLIHVKMRIQSDLHRRSIAN